MSAKPSPVELGKLKRLHQAFITGWSGPFNPKAPFWGKLYERGWVTRSGLTKKGVRVADAYVCVRLECPLCHCSVAYHVVPAKGWVHLTRTCRSCQDKSRYTFVDGGFIGAE